MNNWPIANDGTAVNVTATSAAVQLTGTNAVVADDVMVDNPGPNDVFVRAGDSNVAATVNSLRVPAGTMQPFFKGQGVQWLAFICKPSQTQSIVLHVGDGA